MNLPDNPRDLSRLLVAVTDLHPDNDLRVRHDATQEALAAAGWVRWSGSSKHPGWKLTEAGAEIIRSSQEVTA